MAEFDHLVEELEEFGAEYLEEMREFLSRKVEESKSGENKMLLGILVLTIPAAILIYYAIKLQQLEIMAIFLVFLPFLKLLHRENQERDEHVKEKIMTGMCERIGFTYSFRPDKKKLVPYRGLSIIPAHRYSTPEDEICGTVEGINFRVFEAELENRVDHKLSNFETVFRGILGEFDFPTKFYGATSITRKGGRNSGLLEDYLKAGERIVIDHSEFRQKFDVYSTKPDEVGCFLTQEYMDCILTVAKKLGPNGLQLAFHDGKIYVSIEREKDYFEGGGLSYNDADYFKHNINDITIIFYIIKELNLLKETNNVQEEV